MRFLILFCLTLALASPISFLHTPLTRLSVVFMLWSPGSLEISRNTIQRLNCSNVNENLDYFCLSIDNEICEIFNGLVGKRQEINNFCHFMNQYDSERCRPRNYTFFYEALVKEYFQNDNLAILEIGSKLDVDAWAEYLPSSKVFMADPVNMRADNNKSVKRRLSGTNSKYPGVYYSGIADFFHKIGESQKFDIIIDRFNPNLQLQEMLVTAIFRKLKRNGIYVIENVDINN